MWPYTPVNCKLSLLHIIPVDFLPPRAGSKVTGSETPDRQQVMYKCSQKL